MQGGVLPVALRSVVGNIKNKNNLYDMLNIPLIITIIIIQLCDILRNVITSFCFLKFNFHYLFKKNTSLC